MLENWCITGSLCPKKYSILNSVSASIHVHKSQLQKRKKYSEVLFVMVMQEQAKCLHLQQVSITSHIGWLEIFH